MTPQQTTDLPAKPLTVNCWITQQPGTPANWPDGHQKCEAPGYQHPVLGWMPVPCTCTCHTEGGTS